MAQGGARKGAGRKKGLASIASEAARAKIAELVTQEIEPITFALINAATGIKYKKGYARPDVMAAKELFERAFGKVTDKLKIEEVKRLIKLDE
jgi:hypothetical protein